MGDLRRGIQDMDLGYEEEDGSRAVRFAGQMTTVLHDEITGVRARRIAAVRRLRMLGKLRRGRRDPEFRVELDSHAEQSVVSSECALILRTHSTTVSVYGYDHGESRRCKVVDAVVGYRDPSTGDVWMLVINQALEVPGIAHPLLCSNQLRMNALTVNDEPKALVSNPTERTHAIAVPIPDSEDEELLIPLSIHGVFSYFPATIPTKSEWEGIPEERCLELTAQTPEWEPSEMDLEEDEANMLGDDGRLKTRYTENWDQECVNRIVATLSRERVWEPSAAALADAIESNVQVPSCESSMVKVKRKRQMYSITTAKKQWKVGPAALAKRWGVGLGAARRTMDATTQHSVRSHAHPTLSRRFASHDKGWQFRRLSAKMYTDTMFAHTKSWHRKNKCGQVYATSFGWIGFYPMIAKSEAHETFTLLCQEKGVPSRLIMDNAKEQIDGEFKRKTRKYSCRVKQIDPYSQWQNQAEDGIRELKKHAARAMVSAQSPRKLWDHCFEWSARVISHTARGHYTLQNQVPETILTGETADISALAEYGWYDWVVYLDPRDHEEHLGRWLGPANDDVGSAMTSKILQKNCEVIYCPNTRPLTQTEWESSSHQQTRAEYDEAVQAKLKEPLLSDDDIAAMDEEAVTPITFAKDNAEVQKDTREMEEADDTRRLPFNDEESHQPLPDNEADNHVEDAKTPQFADNYVGAVIDVVHMGEPKTGTVKRRSRNNDGELIGEAHSNPLLDTRQYEVEFPNGEVSDYTANIIAESMISQCDEDGYDVKLMEAIVDHRKDGNAVTDADRYFISKGRRYPKKTTAGWQLCVQWKSGYTSWECLKDLKESYPVEVAEYAKAVGIQHEPAFSWWTEHVLKKRDRMIAKVTKRYHRITHKFGIELPKSVAHAYEIDARNGNTLWRDAIEKEMKNVRIAFKIIPEDGEVPPGFQQMSCHMIFDVKFGEGFRRKARMVAGGHMVDTPAHMRYASVVSRETVRIALTAAALNGLEVKASDIQNAYLTAPCAEKIWTLLGPEFGDDAGKKATIVRALYGLGSAGSSFTAHLASCMRHIGYVPCRADPDLWMQEATHSDGGKYYKYILLYCDDCIAAAEDATAELMRLNHYFQMKEGSIGDPDIYLGTKLRTVKFPEDGVNAWSMSSSKYIQEATANVRRHLKEKGHSKSIPKKVNGPWPRNYEPELDQSVELNADDATLYQHLIGVLHWIVEIGRVDIITEVSVLAAYLACPRDGHLDAALNVYGYLTKKHNARLILDPRYPEIDMKKFPKEDWNYFYGPVKEMIPPDMPTPLGREIILRMYVDASHANDRVNRRSRTGFFIFMQQALIQWCSKKQPTVESSVFGAEFVAMKHGLEICRGLRYKIRMMGIPLNTPTFVYGDNNSVIINTSRPQSQLQKKSHSICFHFIREAVAMDEARTTHVLSKENMSDLASKLIPNGQLRDAHVSKLLWDINGKHADDNDDE